MSELIYRQNAIDAMRQYSHFDDFDTSVIDEEIAIIAIKELPSAQPEIIRCKDCKWWRQQINYQGNPLSFNPLPFGCCESDDMWRSLCGETYEVSQIDTDEDFYCGYAQLRGERDEVD